MRLKKSEIEEYKQLIKRYKEQKTIYGLDTREYKHAWDRLTYEHSSRLSLALKHVSDIPVKDSLESDCIDGEKLFNTESYFKHYDDRTLESILHNDIWLARHALDTIERQLRDEIARRKKGTPKR